jgi:hypothetical protein
MICPDIGAHYILVKWVFTLGQAIVVVVIWEILKLLSRLTKPKGPGTTEP